MQPSQSDPPEIVLWDADRLSTAIHAGEVSCVEVMSAYLDHIDRVNPQVNAIVALRPRELLLDEAAERDRQLAEGTSLGWMHGFPQAIKDLSEVAGWSTSHGFFRDPYPAPVAAADDVFVERIRAAGAVFIGRTNTPEFGLGSHTYNSVYGTTLNAYDQSRSAGGSSGGAAVAVALRMLPVADGSDFMGSLRNPPGWNNVLGLRPTVGRVPVPGADRFTSQGGVAGPIARTARDLGRLLDTMAGYDPRDPLSLDAAGARQHRSASRDGMRGVRIAWLGDLGGYLATEPEVLEVTRSALRALEDAGAEVIDHPMLPSHGTFSGTDDLWPTWLTYRHSAIASRGAALYAHAGMRAMMKPELIYEIEGAIATSEHPAMTVMELAECAHKRSDLYEAMRQLFETVGAVAIPTAQLFPSMPAGPGRDPLRGARCRAITDGWRPRRSRRSSTRRRSRCQRASALGDSRSGCSSSGRIGPTATSSTSPPSGSASCRMPPHTSHRSSRLVSQPLFTDHGEAL